jgi:hypothetical protein
MFNVFLNFRIVAGGQNSSNSEKYEDIFQDIFFILVFIIYYHSY